MPNVLLPATGLGKWLSGSLGQLTHGSVSLPSRIDVSVSQPQCPLAGGSSPAWLQDHQCWDLLPRAGGPQRLGFPHLPPISTSRK